MFVEASYKDEVREDLNEPLYANTMATSRRVVMQSECSHITSGRRVARKMKPSGNSGSVYFTLSKEGLAGNKLNNQLTPVWQERESLEVVAHHTTWLFLSDVMPGSGPGGGIVLCDV